MANGYFANYRNLQLGGGTHTLPDMNSDTIEVSLIDTADVTINTSTMQDEADITAGIVATVALSNVTIGSVGVGVFDSDNPIFDDVTGDSAEALVMHKGAGTAATDPLIANYDTFSSGMPVTPNGGDIVVTVPSGGWFTNN